MTVDALRARLLDTLLNYHRVRAATAYVLHDGATRGRQAVALRYTNVATPVEALPDFGAGDTLRSALEAIDRYAKERLAHDAFLALIAALEEFVSAWLRAHGAKPTGTLGKLLGDVQKTAGLADTLSAVEDAAEVRERRNCFIHEHGAPSDAYEKAAAKVVSRYPAVVPAAGSVARLPCDGAYLAHVVDVFVRYARRLPPTP